jgi:hypothetical protein
VLLHLKEIAGCQDAQILIKFLQQKLIKIIEILSDCESMEDEDQEKLVNSFIKC